MENKYKPKEFAEMLNVSVKTLQRWDNEGILVAYRTPTDRRHYTHSQYLDYIGDSSREENRGRNIIYSRVSSQGQKDDLANQTEFLRQFANARGIIVVNNEKLSPQQEMIQDLISIIHVFSCRINGLRRYKNQIKGDSDLC